MVPTSVPETFIAIAEATAVAMDTPTPQETNEPTLTVEAVQTSDSQVSQHGFELTKMPPGTKQGYLVHIVSVGETLDMIAEDYNTSVQAILAANHDLKPPVWAQYPIVIPVNCQDPAGLVAFDVYVVNEYESIEAESLADILGLNASELKFYNLCTDTCQFNKGDVLLVPHNE
jgi:LysM repeat protein